MERVVFDVRATVYLRTTRDDAKSGDRVTRFIRGVVKKERP